MCPLSPTEPEPGSGTFAQGNLHARGRNQLVAVNTVTARLRVWFLQRGVLYGLTQTPMIALIVGFIFKWTTYPLATTFTVLPCLMLLPVWILYRRRVSSDPDEPSNRFPQLALWALFPVIAFDLARIPMHYALGNVFWGTWFGFGSSLTGQPASHWTSLAAGTFLHIFQGYVLALGYYVLFRRASLASALGYLFVMLSAVYSWLFPHYVVLGPTPVKWYVVLWWAHLWFAVTAWAVPRLDTPALRRRLRRPASACTAATAGIAVAAAPFGLVFWRAGTWQFPAQDAIDRAAFARIVLLPEAAPVTAAANADGETDYRIVFRLGPRDYTDFEGVTQATGALTLQITGDIRAAGTPIGFCSAPVRALPSAAAISTPATFTITVRMLDYTTIPVNCPGTALVAGSRTSTGRMEVRVRWTATATLDSDRDTGTRSFGGTQTEILAVPRHSAIAR